MESAVLRENRAVCTLERGSADEGMRALKDEEGTICVYIEKPNHHHHDNNTDQEKTET